MIQPVATFSVFIVKNLNSEKEFYTSHFGFNVAFENEWYLHLISETGIQVGFMLPNQPTQPTFFQPHFEGDGVILSLEVNDADSAYKYAQENAFNVVLELKSEEWGQRHFVLEDPNGVHVDVLQETEPSSEYQDGYEK